MNLRPKIIDLLEEIIWSKLLDIGLGNGIFRFDTQSKSNNSKNKQADYIKLKSFCIAKKTVKKWRVNLLNGKKELQTTNPIVNIQGVQDLIHSKAKQNQPTKQTNKETK